MMNYEIFKEVVAEKFKSYLPERYQHMELRVESVNKVNRVMDGITLIDNTAEKNISPTMYINDMYDQYLVTENLQKVLTDAAESMDKAFLEAPMAGILDMDNARDNIVFQVINTVQNEDMLRDMPHRDYQDLSIIYRWVVAIDDRGVQSTIVRDNLAKQLGMTEADLFKCAVENTRRIFPPVVKSMNDVMKEMFLSDGMPPEIADMMIEEMPADRTMWIISNDRGLNGAGSMLYEEVLHKLSM